MAKPGDRVRFLNSTGGGVITRIDGKTAYVEDEDGFETPLLIKDLVVVLPAGHEATVLEAARMFDQRAFDEGRKQPEKVKDTTPQTPKETVKEILVEETPHGDSPEIILAFEPDDAKKLSNARFSAVLVNDSNYYLDFIFMKRSDNDRGWVVDYRGTVLPNELIDVAVITHENLHEYERVALQCVAYKNDKAFSLLPPVNVSRKLDLTKFHKFHCFHPSKYFDTPVIEFPLVKAGEIVENPEFDPRKLESLTNAGNSDKNLVKELSKKYRTDFDKKPRTQQASVSPFKKLPLIEIDLHIGELTDTTAGMEPKHMLEMQLAEVRKTMQAHSKRSGQKIVFIHGKGDGVLRKAVWDLLKKEYPKADLQDASFREYGFGATLVTI